MGGDCHDVVGETTDPEGRSVVLLSRVWHDKALLDHPELAGSDATVLEAVGSPDHSEPDPSYSNRARYYRRGAGPSRWLLVVVSCEQNPARIISAFGDRKGPRSWSA